jgi:hypothetical protein
MQANTDDFRVSVDDLEAGQDLDDHFTCLVCIDVVNEPVECDKCDRLFCKSCA